MLPVTAPLNIMPPVAQPQLEAIRRDNARFEPIPEPAGTGAGSRGRPEADDYDRNRTGVETRDAATRGETVRGEGARAEAGNAVGPRNDASGRVDPDGRNNQNSQGSPQQGSSQQGSSQQGSSQQGSQGSSQQGSSQQEARERQQDRQVQVQVTELKARDREVRAHESAHAAVGGQYAGAPSFQYQKGPDGRRYAVGGEVSIDVSPVPDNPQATIRKLETVRAAALAPADPSPQDRQVAARATALIAEARRQLAAQLRNESSSPTGTGASSKASLASDSASDAVFGSDAELQSPPDSGLTVFPDAQLRSPCPMCSKPHLSPVSSATTPSASFSLTARLRSLGVTDYSSREFRASA